jgi:hypothetical protein
MGFLGVLLGGAALVVAIYALVSVTQLRSQLGGGTTAPAGVIRSSDNAWITVRLVKHPSVTDRGAVSQDYRFYITNEGGVSAHNINVEVTDGEQLLFKQETDEKLPCPILNPGDSIVLCSRIGIGSPRVIETAVNWLNPDGSMGVAEYPLTKELK